jgi:GntR family transcriptional regulator
MFVALDQNDPRPIYVQIVDEVRRALVVGDLAADDLLPSVRRLATDLRVNPNTVSQAYRELEREGVVEVRRGQGTYVVKATVNGTQRKAILRDVAARALRDAHRNGLTADDLVRAIQVASALATHSNRGL